LSLAQEREIRLLGGGGGAGGIMVLALAPLQEAGASRWA
jgi:hypothetical protein